MYWAPCARLMKSITPNTSVRPAATRNKRTPSCSPLRIWTARRVVDMGDPRRARSLGARCSPRHKRVHARLRRAMAEEGADQMRGVHAVPNVGTLLHRTILGVRIGVVLEHLLDDLGLELAVGALGDLDQVEVLDRIVVGVELEAPAQRLEIRLHHGGAQRLLTLDLAHGAVDQERGVV